MKKLFAIAIFLSAALHLFAADTVSYKIRKIENWAFYGWQYPTVQVVAANERGVHRQLNLKCEILNYNGRSLYELIQLGTVNPKDSLDMAFSFKTLTPGFYNALFWDNGRVVKSVNIAYEPEKIVSTEHFRDSLPVSDRNFNRVVEGVNVEKGKLSRQFSAVKNKRLSGKEKTVYDFKMTSREGKVVKGYVAVPRQGKKFPAMITYVPVEVRNENPLADFTARGDMIEMVLYMGERGNGETYFWNTATDISLAIEYIMMRKDVDPAAVYTQGERAGAAFSVISSAIDNRIKVSFGTTPDFSRFIEYFTPESLAANVSAPVLLGLGLQDKTIRLQEDFAVYNSIKGVKEYFIFPQSDDVERKKWKYIRDTFLLRLKAQ